jgi:uncharacterized cupredoxin-like copper-binding protein
MRIILSVWLIAISMLLAACGGTASPATELDVTLTDFQFAPSSFTVPAGKEITLNARNSGAVIHNFIIMNLSEAAGPEFDERDLPNVYWKLEIPAGGNASAVFTAPEQPGEYQIVCNIPGHLQAGMVGTLTVVESE